MNKFILEPTDENLERFKQIKETTIYWHTADFFRYDSAIEDELSVIFDAYTDVFWGWKTTDKTEFSIALIIIKGVRKNNISSQDCQRKFDNYIKVSYSLKSNL